MDPDSPRPDQLDRRKTTRIHLPWTDLPEANIRAFNKKVKHRVYQVDDLVVKRIILPQGDPRGKWTPTYEGPFVVKTVFSGGAMILSTMDGEDLPLPMNADIVKKYYA